MPRAMPPRRAARAVTQTLVVAILATIVALCTLCDLCSARGLSAPGQLSAKAPSGAGGGGVTPCGRGLPAPCIVTCSVSSRFCKACCAAVAAFTTAAPDTSANGNAAAATASPPPDSALEDMALGNATSCLAPCLRFTAKEIREALSKPVDQSDRITEMALQLKEVKADRDWDNLLKGPRLFTICEGLNCF